MTVTSAAEFSVAKSWQSDRRGPVRWLLSHVLRHKIYIVGLFLGALGNGVGAGLVPMFVGRGFNVIVDSEDLQALAWIALLLPPFAGPLLLMVAFLGALGNDFLLKRAGLAPGWFFSMRLTLTAVVVACLAIAATDDRSVNQRVARLAGERGIPVNVVDQPRACSFIMPSIIDRSPVVIAVSTSSASPVLARLLRVPLVFDFQGSLTGEMVDHSFLREGGVIFRLVHRLERFICRRADATLTSSLRAETIAQLGLEMVR